MVNVKEKQLNKYHMWDEARCTDLGGCKLWLRHAQETRKSDEAMGHYGCL